MRRLFFFFKLKDMRILCDIRIVLGNTFDYVLCIVAMAELFFKSVFGDFQIFVASG